MLDRACLTLVHVMTSNDARLRLSWQIIRTVCAQMNRFRFRRWSEDVICWIHVVHLHAPLEIWINAKSDALLELQENRTLQGSLSMPRADPGFGQMPDPEVSCFSCCPLLVLFAQNCMNWNLGVNGPGGSKSDHQLHSTTRPSSREEANQVFRSSFGQGSKKWLGFLTRP